MLFPSEFCLPYSGLAITITIGRGEYSLEVALVEFGVQLVLQLQEAANATIQQLADLR